MVLSTRSLLPWLVCRGRRPAGRPSADNRRTRRARYIRPRRTRKHFHCLPSVFPGRPRSESFPCGCWLPAKRGSTFGTLSRLGRVAVTPFRSAEPVDPPPRTWVSKLPLAAPAVLPAGWGSEEKPSRAARLLGVWAAGWLVRSADPLGLLRSCREQP